MANGVAAASRDDGWLRMANGNEKTTDDKNDRSPGLLFRYSRFAVRHSFRLRRLAIISLLTVAGVYVLVALFQSRLIYFPSRHYYATPKDVGLLFEERALITSDGPSITAWYVPCPQAKGSIIFCHGNAGNMADRLHDVTLMHRMGYNVLIFDYRGYGNSEGKPSEQGTYHDAQAAWRYLVESLGESPARVILFGRSLGGAVAIELAKRHEPGALVVESTFSSLVDVGKLHYPLLPVSLLLRYRYESIDKVSSITCPKLFIHSTDDQLVPLANARRLFEAAASPKMFIETPGDHNNGGYAYSPAYTNKLQAFLDESLKSPARPFRGAP